MTKTWMCAAMGLGLAMIADRAWAQQNEPAGVPPRAGAARAHADAPAGDLPGPIDSVRDLQDTGKMLFKLADTNNDGQISQKEAIDAGNLLVGGFFFRADQNGDGKVTQDEARQARDALLQQQPMLRFLVERARTAGAGQNQPGGTAQQNPIRALGNMLDGNNDKALEATELRRAVQTAVQTAYETADTNRDGQLSPTELNAAMVGAARSAAQAAFQAADTDRNGAISLAEFDKAIQEPAHAAFRMVDANGDGQISQEEARSARRIIMSQLRMLQVPDAPNSPANLIGSGRRPEEVAPVPNFGAPNAPSRTTPAPGAAPAPGQPPR